MEGLTLNAGVDHALGRATLNLNIPTFQNQRAFPAPDTIPPIQARHDRLSNYTQGYYAELVFKPWPKLMLVPGLRIEHFDFQKDHDFAAMPRFTARWQIFGDTTLKAAYGIYNKLPRPQYMIAGIGNPSLLPERSEQFVAGIEHTFTPLNNVDFQLYYNKRYRLVSPSSNAMFGNSKYDAQIWSNEGTGRSYGLEILLRHLPSPDSIFYGWIAYTLSRSWRQDHAASSAYTLVDTDNGAQTVTPYGARATTEYLSPFDQTHILTVIGQWILPWGLQAGFRFRLVSGDPITPLNQARVYYDADSDAYVVDPNSVKRNSSRLPTFDQLDVRIDKTWTYDLWRLTAFLEVLNVYNATNVEAIQYDYRYQDRVDLSLLPVIPVLGVKGEF